MKAILCEQYGSADVLRLADVPEPEAAAGRVLVRVRAASVNALDWHLMQGKPYLARLGGGFRRPKDPRVGVDVAGVVVSVGPGVEGPSPGDRVFGSAPGAFAEVASGRNLVPMPDRLTFEEAAALPTAGLTALQGLRDHGRLSPGDDVLIIGAGGGVGTFAVQVAAALGGRVTATTRADSLDLVASLGADTVLDHARDDPLAGGARYDVVLDNGGIIPLADIQRSLKPDGRLVMVAPGPGLWIGPLVRMAGAGARSMFSRRTMRAFLTKGSREGFRTLAEMADAGQVTPVIDSTFPLDAVPDAIRRVEAGGVRGKVVITVA